MISPLGQQLAAYYTKPPRRYEPCGSLRGAVCGEPFAADIGAAVRLLCVGCRFAGATVCGARAVPGLLRGVSRSGRTVRRLCCAIGWTRCFPMWVRCFSACGWQAGQCGWRWNFSARCGRVLRRKTPGTARRLAVRFAAALALSAAFAAVGAFFTVMGIRGRRALTAFAPNVFLGGQRGGGYSLFSCSRLMWV